MPTYPAYVHRLLAQAHDEGQWYAGQAGAAALCFEVLVLFPNNREAAGLVYELFCDEWLIHDNRNALQQHIDEWDDRPWQQRRRLALSFRFMSRWEGWHREYEEGFEHEREGPTDVVDLLEKGHDRLLTAYCLGDDEATNYAWTCFDKACRQTHDARAALLWVGKQYADLGFFADAAEVLTELHARFNAKSASRLLAEVRWWRDNAHRIPWLPPPGDGSRYKRMMRFIEPNAPNDEEAIEQLRAELGLPESADQNLALNPDLAEVIDSAISALPAEPAPHEVHVDWSFLDTDDGRPGELPKWAKRMARLLPADIADDIVRRHRWSRPISPPATPPRHNPYEPPFEPGEFLS